MLDQGLLRQLNPLHYVVKEAALGRVGGRQLSKRKGLSLDFAEHRNYLPGDDYRYIDWNLYGRLDRLFVKVFSREEDYPVYLLVDLSKSMRIGNKLQRAGEVAGALGYIALKDQNRLGVYPFSKGIDIDNAWYPRSGFQQTLTFFEYLDNLKPQTETDFNHSMTQFAHLRFNRGLVVVLSDMFSEQGYEEGLIALRSGGYSVVVMQLLAEEDINPELLQEVWLTSIEQGPSRRRLNGPESVDIYLQAVRDYNDKLQEFCHHHEIGHLRLPVTMPLEQVVFEQLRGRVLT